MKYKPLANSYDELSVELWQEVQEILKDKETDAIDKNVQLVGLLYDIPDEAAYELPLDQFSDMLDGIGWLTKDPVVPHAAPGYEINGNKYIVNLNPSKITTAQYIDFRSVNTDVPKNLHLILACIMVPYGHEYNDGYDMEQVQKDIRTGMRMTHALALVRFFFQQYIRLTTNSLSSLKRILRKEMKKEKDQEKKSKIEQQIKKTEELELMIGSLV